MRTATTMSYARLTREKAGKDATAAVVLLVVAVAQDLMGGTGLFAAAALSGLTDVDAITLSTARLVSTERLTPAVGWRLVMIAALSNLVFKLLLAGTLGSRAFARRLGGLGLVAIAAGGLLLVFWAEESLGALKFRQPSAAPGER